MTSYIVANWKMNGSLEMAQDYCAAFSKLSKENASANEIILCPPHPYLIPMSDALHDTSISLGAQDCSAAEKGAYTGETSASMLLDTGCTYVIIGHSERRQHHKESNELLTCKITQALAADLTPIFCIGESNDDFEGGKTQEILTQQLQALEAFKGNEKIIIAYEPVWAIGTGKVASLDDIEKTSSFLKGMLLKTYQLSSPVLYGGSVKGSNAQDILSLPSVNGVLVGGASLDPAEFWKIAAS